MIVNTSAAMQIFFITSHTLLFFIFPVAKELTICLLCPLVGLHIS